MATPSRSASTGDATGSQTHHRALAEPDQAATSRETSASNGCRPLRRMSLSRLTEHARAVTVAGAAAAVVVAALIANGVTRSTPSHKARPAQGVTPSAAPAQPSTSPPTPLAQPTPPSTPLSSATLAPPPRTDPMTGTPSPQLSVAQTASVVKQIPLPGSGADAIAIDSGTAYVVQGVAAGEVELLDLTTDVVGKTIGVGAAPVAIAVDPGMHTAYVVNSGAGTVSVIDKSSASVVATVAVGKKPVAIAIDSTRHLAYVVNNAANSVSILDETTNTVTATLQVGPAPVAVAVDTTTDTIFVANANGGQGSISNINGASHTVTPTEALGALPVGLDLDPAASTLYVETTIPTSNSSPVAASLWIMDEKTLFTSGTTRLSFDPSTDVASVLDGVGHTLYVVTSPSDVKAAGRLLVLPVPDNFLGDPPYVPVGTAPKAVALDPATHDLYVVNGDNTITLVAGIGSRSPA